MGKIWGEEKGNNKSILQNGNFCRLEHVALDCQLRVRSFLGVSSAEALLDPSVVDAQELVLSGGHVDKIRLTLGPLFVQELVHRLVGWGLAQIGADDLVQSLTQMRRAALGGGVALGDVFAGFIHCRVNAGEAHDRAALREAADVADLSHQLNTGRLTHAVHGPDSLVLRKLLSKPGHLRAHNSQCSFSGGELLGSSGDEQLGVTVFGQGCDMTHTVHVQLRRFLEAEMVTLSFAPLVVAICKDGLADHADTLTVPEGYDKMDPFLASIGPVRA